MYITLTAAFQSEEQPDYETLGITPGPEDFNDVDWMPLHVHYDYIATVNENEAGTTNLILITGEKWTVQESPSDIISQVSYMAKKYK